MGGSSLWKQGVSYLDNTQRTYIREEKLRRLNWELWQIGKAYSGTHNHAATQYSQDTQHIYTYIYHKYIKPKEEYLQLRTPPHDTLAWVKITWKQYYPDEKWYVIDFDKLDIDGDYWPNALADATKIKEGQEWKFYNPADLDRAVEAELHEQRTIFLNFLWELKEVIQALSQTQILGDSGEEEIVMGHGIQLSSAEMIARIANQLSGLVNYSARVKIGGHVPQNPWKKCLNCGVQNNSGDLYCKGCGTKITGADEYAITTLAPTKGLVKAAFDQQKAYIQSRNRDPRYGGYCRPRNEVEDEIINRQIGCNGSSAVQPQQPQQPSPQPQPRHARQVPVQGKCPNPNCRASNATGANFCMKCGTKL